MENGYHFSDEPRHRAGSLVKIEFESSPGRHMQSITIFSLEKHGGPYQSWPRLTRLFVNGADTGKKIPGFVIEAQYRCGDHYLLITSQDCPFEESNDFLLLDLSYDLVDRKGLLVPYCSFLIANHWLVPGNAVRVHYHNELFYTVRIEPSRNPLSDKPRLTLERLAAPPPEQP